MLDLITLNRKQLTLPLSLLLPTSEPFPCRLLAVTNSILFQILHKEEMICTFHVKLIVLI